MEEGGREDKATGDLRRRMIYKEGCFKTVEVRERRIKYKQQWRNENREGRRAKKDNDGREEHTGLARTGRGVKATIGSKMDERREKE